MKIFFVGFITSLALLPAFEKKSHIVNPQKPGQQSIYFDQTVAPYGTIYNQSAWTTTNDFITNANTNATISGNFVNISCTNSYDWNNTIYITDYRTKLEKWRFRLRFKLLSWAPNSYGIGIGLKSANENVQNDVLGFLQTANNGVGGLYIVKSNQQVLSTGSTALGVALNDIIDLEAAFHDSVFIFKAHNLSSGTMASISFTYASNGSTAVVPNSSYFSILELGGTHQVQYIDISSDEKAGANIVTIGDSKTIGYFSNSFAGRYAARLNNNYPDALINAGGGDRITHVLSRKTELERLAGNKYLLSIGSNDLRFGGSLATLQHHYDSLVRILLATGAQVYHIVLPEDHTKSGAVNLLAFKNWVASTYVSNYINVWDSLSTGNVLKGIYDTGDGVHLNQLANDKIYEAIVASNKLGGGTTLPVSLLSFEVKKLNTGQASVRWKTDLYDLVDHFIIMKSADGIFFEPLAELPANTTGTYRFDDPQPISGYSSYKLKITETNGTSFYSKVGIIYNKTNAVEITGWQKTNTGHYDIAINAQTGCRVEWRILDITGSILSAGTKQLLKGRNTLGITSTILPKKVNYLTLLGENGEKLASISFFP